MKKVKHRKVKEQAQGHIAKKWKDTQETDANDKLKETGWSTVGVDGAGRGKRKVSGCSLSHFLFSNYVDELYIWTSKIYKTI